MDTRIDVLFKVEGQHITSASDVIITSGSRNYYHSVFEFDAVWLNLSPKAVFTVGKKSYIIPLNSIDGKYECVIPWEVIDRDTGFYVGAFGGDSLSSDLTFVAVSKGAQVEGELPQPPTPDWYNSIERLTDKAVNTATEVQQRADNGEFDGKPGKDGDNGKSAYEVAVEKGFIGTEEEWLASLHGKDGADGYTPVKGVDYFDGADGEDGVGIQSVEQTITSTADGGENEVTVTLTNGTKTTFKVKNGSKGSTGEKGEPGTSGADGSDANVTSENIAAALGYTPANAQDVTDLSEEIVNYLPKNQGSSNVGKILVVGTDGNLTLTDMPEGGVSGDVTGVIDESNNILLSGNIADGTYALKWIYDDGSIKDAGELIVSSITAFSIITTLENCTSSGATSIRTDGSATVTITANTGYALPDSITVSGASHTWDKSTGNIVLSNPTSDVYITVTAKKTITNFAEYNADNTTDWSIWINNARIGSDGTYRSDTTDDELGTPAVSNYIAVQNGDTVEFEGIYTAPKSSILCDSNKTKIENGAIKNLTNVTDITESTAITYAGQFTINNPNTAFIRIGGYVGVYKHPVSDISIKIKRDGEYL